MTTANGRPTFLLLDGKEWNPLDPDPEMITIDIIAHALSQEYRFANMLPKPYSVAQHSVLVSEEVERYARATGVKVDESGADLADMCMWGLLHEVGEALSGFGDVPGPVKRVPEVAAVVKPIERKIEDAASSRFGFRFGFAKHPAVKRADILLLAWEDRDVRDRGWDHGHDVGAPPRDIVIPDQKIVPWGWRAARDAFVTRWDACCALRGAT